MVRSAAAVLACLILPGIALAQQAQGTHTVVDGNTLWGLSATYYGDPFDWRRIWEANQTQIDDPNLIEPGQVLVIPGTAPEAPATEPVAPAEPEPQPTRNGLDVRTIFFEDTVVARAGVIRGVESDHIAVPRDQVYSSPRLTGFEGDPWHTETLTGEASGRTRDATVRGHARVHVAMETAARVGDQLQVFAVTRTIEDVGRVVVPTAVINVSEIVEDGIIGVIVKEYGRIVPGQFIAPLPEYDFEAGEYAQPVSNGALAMVIGTANRAILQDLGHIVFLDVGSEDNVGLGDEFTFFNQVDTDAAQGRRLQVVGAQAGMAAARVVHISSPVFEQGVVVRLTKKMR